MQINSQLTLACSALILSLAFINPSMAQKVSNETNKSQTQKRTFTISTVNQVTNGAVVPITISFNPPMQRGDKFQVLQNGKVITTVLVKDGLMSEFSYRVRMLDSRVITSVTCQSCTGDDIISSIDLPFLPPSENTFNNDSNVIDLKINARAGVFKALATSDNTTKGSAELTSNGLHVFATLSKYISKDPFFGFKGTINQGEACLTYTSNNSIKKCGTVLENSPPVPSTEKIFLTCSIMVNKELRPSEIEINLGELTANGRPMKVTDNSFSWLNPDGKVETTISRVTGVTQTTQIIDDNHFKAGRILFTGTCQPARKEKLF